MRPMGGPSGRDESSAVLTHETKHSVSLGVSEDTDSNFKESILTSNLLVST